MILLKKTFNAFLIKPSYINIKMLINVIKQKY